MRTIICPGYQTSAGFQVGSRPRPVWPAPGGGEVASPTSANRTRIRPGVLRRQIQPDRREGGSARETNVSIRTEVAAPPLTQA